MRTWLFGLIGALMLAAPVQAQDAPAVDPAVWQGEATTGPIVHRASQVSFPDEVAGFRREQVATLAPDDVAIRYRRREGRMETTVSVYLFRPGAAAEHRLRGSVLAFAAQSPEAFVWSSGPFSVPGETPLHGYKGTFKTGIGPNTIMDYLYFLELGVWTVKVRATVSGISEIEQEGRIDSLVRSLPWSQILVANGACSGRACSSPAFESIEHHITQTTLGPLLFSGDRYDARQERRLPVVHRAGISIMGEAEIRRSEQAPLVYVTTVPQLATYRLFRFPEPANRMLTETFGMLSIDKPVYGLEIRMGRESLMPRLFVGEPTPEAFAEAVSSLVLNEVPNSFLPVAALARSLPE